jgi:hypothetical protein
MESNLSLILTGFIIGNKLTAGELVKKAGSCGFKKIVQ